MDDNNLRQYAIRAVRVDALGRISRVVMEVSAPGKAISLQPFSASGNELDAATVAGMIASGCIVKTLFLHDAAPVFGPMVRRVDYGDGYVGIELSEDIVGHTYRDLVQIDE